MVGLEGFRPPKPYPLFLPMYHGQNKVNIPSTPPPNILYTLIK